MAKKLILGVVVLLVVAGIGVTVWARSVLTGDNVRAAIAEQVSDAIGQPVTIGQLSASVYPRVVVDLGDVTIGQPAAITLASVRLGTDFRALLSRRIEHADVRVDGATIAVPLPEFAVAAAAPSSSDGAAPPVELVSIDGIVLENVSVTSGNRTLTGSIDLVPSGTGVTLRQVLLHADDTDVTLTGDITSFAPLEGRIAASSDELDFDRLMAFLGDFSANAVPATSDDVPSGAADAPAATASRLEFTLALGKARTGGLELSDVAATALVTPEGLTLSPFRFGVFGGRYDGQMRLALGDTPRFAWDATVTGMDAARLMAFADSPDTLTGTLSGKVSLTGSGLEMEQALRSARGTARLDITNGSVTGLSLVRTIVTATSMRGGIVKSAATAAATSSSSKAESEAFSRLGATLTLANGVMQTDDLLLESTDADLAAAGTITVASMTTAFAGRVKLSEKLSKEGGTDLYRYAQQDGRVTLPATVSGPLDNLSVRIDIQDAAKRAITNRATEEAKKAIERNLPGKLKSLIKRKPPGY
ncbi:MAG: AsmA family protein [Vicinamibacterales bacterium]